MKVSEFLDLFEDLPKDENIIRALIITPSISFNLNGKNSRSIERTIDHVEKTKANIKNLKGEKDGKPGIK